MQPDEIRDNLATIHADNFNPVRKIAITIYIESDADCEVIAKSMHRLLGNAGVCGYQLGVAPVEGK